MSTGRRTDVVLRKACPISRRPRVPLFVLFAGVFGEPVLVSIVETLGAAELPDVSRETLSDSGSVELATRFAARLVFVVFVFERAVDGEEVGRGEALGFREDGDLALGASLVELLLSPAELDFLSAAAASRFLEDAVVFSRPDALDLVVVLCGV